MQSSSLKTRFDPTPADRSNQPGDIKVAALNVSFFYGALQALHAVTLNIHACQVTALIGPSGCGKSTLLRCINRMNDDIPGARMTGTLLLDGCNISDMDVISLRKRVGMVLQRPNPFPKSIFENVAYGPRVHGERNRIRLEEVVELSLIQAALWDEVKDRLHRNALELSIGQQQRLCIARILAVDPEVLLMDEPCSALDPIATFHIEELIVHLKTGYTIVLVTHNMQQAARVSDRTGLLVRGELIELGSTAKLFTQPDDPRTEDYIRGRFG